MRMRDGLYVQYGCGFSAPEEWRSFDASPTLRFERLPLVGKLYTRNSSRFPRNVEYGNIVEGLPLPQESCRAVYSSHVLEHLGLVDFKKAIRHTYRLLKPGGVFRSVLPDLEFLANRYVEDGSQTAAPDFMRNSYLGICDRPRGIRGLLSAWLGNSKHLWMWDFKSIEAELKDCGFVDIRRAKYGDSTDPMFQYVEDETRWINCLGLECHR